uniref:Uncharacterized protein n=1 Tax=Tetraselmis chuii TaxID=63592 RepID=A0A7S1X5N2_9CHLO|mmetsp:Transcript_33608/g.60108  ORF Transcript_33608/g.60108 Transcript_33608/m.60108 type:complete len:120 (+) Transcript_33608:448-807(+)
MQAAQNRVDQFEHGWRDNIVKEERAEREAGSPFATIFKPVDASFYNDYNDMDYDTIAMLHFGPKPPPAPSEHRSRKSTRSSTHAAQARLKKLQMEVAECKKQHHTLRKQAMSITSAARR